MPKFYKNNPDDKIWWKDTSERCIGEFVFSFDKETEFNLFRDYPHELTEEQKQIFDEENPHWKEFFKDRNEEILLHNAYQISGTLNTIRRLKRKFPDNLEETNCGEMIEDVKKVYTVLKKAIDNYPDDERINTWKDLIQEIENEKLF